MGLELNYRGSHQVSSLRGFFGLLSDVSLRGSSAVAVVSQSKSFHLQDTCMSCCKISQTKASPSTAIFHRVAFQAASGCMKGLSLWQAGSKGSGFLEDTLTTEHGCDSQGLSVR